MEKGGDRTKTVISSTASPFKFPGSVAKAIDAKYTGMDEFSLIEVVSKISGLKIPPTLKDLERREILHKTVCRTDQMRDVISDILGI